MIDYESCASSLFDGGWKSDDIDELINEYELTEEEATTICKYLAEIENY